MGIKSTLPLFKDCFSSCSNWILFVDSQCAIKYGATHAFNRPNTIPCVTMTTFGLCLLLSSVRIGIIFRRRKMILLEKTRKFSRKLIFFVRNKNPIVSLIPFIHLCVRTQFQIGHLCSIMDRGTHPTVCVCVLWQLCEQSVVVAVIWCQTFAFFSSFQTVFNHVVCVCLPVEQSHQRCKDDQRIGRM